MMSTGFEFRVLDGPQAGASVPVRHGLPLRVGGELDNDVVLPEGGLRVTLALTAGEVLILSVEQGVVEVGEVRVTQGQSMTVALDTPMGIGGSRVAVVRAGEGARAMAPPPPSAPALDDAERFARAVDAAAAPPESWLARNVRTLLGVGVGLIVVAGGVMAIAWATGHATPTGDQRVAMVRQALAPTRIPLTVAQRDGQLRVSGHVKDQAARVLVEKTVAATGLEGVKLDLWVNESVTHGASEVFRLNGIAAKASTLGPGMVRLETATADEAVLARAKEAALRDVPGLAELDVVNTPPPGNGARTVADAGKRIASIVAGEPSYVVTQDGARYFPGALLPSGHRIQEIRPNEVVLDLNGQTSRLNF